MLFSLLTLLPLAAAAPAAWYQPRDAPVHELFKRDAPVDFNSPTWAQGFPGVGTPPRNMTPQAWIDKLNAIQLPANNPVATLKGCCSISYPGIKDQGMSPDICSFTTGCHTDTDYFNGPDGTFVLTFDDGPGEASPKLTKFLTENNIAGNATHFMIGINVVGSPVQANADFKAGGHLAVHTWSHKYTTSLSNEDVVAELGWTIKAIADVSEGRIPAFWRPPYGDVDNRVRAIAEGVFGLKTVIWNRDTNDWAIGSNPQFTVDNVRATMETWFEGAKSPGIIALEHELNDNEYNVFTYTFPNMTKNGWSVRNVADAFNLNWYQNAASNTGAVNDLGVAAGSSNVNATAAPAGSGSATVGAASASANAASSASSSATPGAQAGANQAHADSKNAASTLVAPGMAVVVVAAVAALF